MFSPSTNITKIDESIQKLKSKIQREGTQNTDVIRYVGNFLKKILVMESGFILTRIDLGIKKKEWTRRKSGNESRLAVTQKMGTFLSIRLFGIELIDFVNKTHLHIIFQFGIHFNWNFKLVCWYECKADTQNIYIVGKGICPTHFQTHRFSNSTNAAATHIVETWS